MDSSYKTLARPSYLIAFLLVLVPLFDNFLSVLPLQLSDERWRFGAVGMFSSTALVPLLGLLLAIFVATSFDHRRIRRFLGWFCAILATLFILILLVFILDFFQARAFASADMKGQMDLAAIASIIKQLFSILTLAFLSGAAFGGPKPSSRRERAKRSNDETPPLIPLLNSSQPE